MNVTRIKQAIFTSLIIAQALILGCAQIPKKHDATTAAIIQPHAGDWPSFGRSYSNQRFSPATKINRSNVKNLVSAWHYKSGVNASFQTTPIVVDGIMYLSLPFNHVVALDAKTGKEMWRYEHQRRQDWKMCCGPANRGVAVALA